MNGEKIAVVTDGSLSSDSTLVTRVVPFYVTYYQEDSSGNFEVVSTRQDQISTEEFLKIQSSSSKPIGTAQPNPNDFLKAYLDLQEQGFNRILVLTVPESKSGTYRSAMIAKDQLNEVKPSSDTTVVVVDTGTTAAGIEYLAYEAMRLVDQGEFFSNIVDRVLSLLDKVELFLTLDKIDYISASGRIEELASRNLSETLKRKARGLASWFARKIHHSPKIVITMKEGRERIGGISRFFNQSCDHMAKDIESRVQSGKKIHRVYLYKHNADLEAERLLYRLHLLNGIEVRIMGIIPVALLAITGPKYLAAVCIYD